jgi:CelD/BcsL family acetyltransferase involved in cellulose biosynthesis
VTPAPLRGTVWNEADFLAGRDAWTALLARSGADPLFQSWDWVNCWWRHHAALLGGQLRVFAFHAPAGELVGLAPFYLHPARHLGLVRTRRLQLLGAAWRTDAAVFSEYLDVIAATEARAPLAAALRAALEADPHWDELVLTNVRHDSMAAQLAQDLGARAYTRRMEKLPAWSIPLPASFDLFTTQLASNTRRKLLHQRSKLADARFVELAPSEWPAALERLERLVARRWGPGDRGPSQAFHAELVGSLDRNAVRLSEVRSSGACVSVMLNIRAGGTEYYLQSGFDPTFARGLSPGYLHLGYAIEAACRDGVRTFDLLAGRGLHRDYKRDLAADGRLLTTFHVLRRGPLRALFRLADRLRGRTDITSRA